MSAEEFALDRHAPKRDVVRSVRIVANPIAGRGRGEQAARALARILVRMGAEVELNLTAGRGEATTLASSAGRADLVIAVGGDGTLSEVLQGLRYPAQRVALLPCGTGNVLAKALDLPGDPERAARAFLAGRVQELDVARVGSRLSHLVVGVGFDAHAVQEVEARRSGPITKGVYVGALLRAFRHHRPVPLRVWIDGAELSYTAGMVWVANTPKYAGVLRVARDTRLDDGQWEVYLFPSGSLGELLCAAARGLFASLPGGPIRMRRARLVRIEAAEPVPYQVDGDSGGVTPVTVELLPERFRLVVP
jgi:YegS/Rv2252/BmrU family lipid kinase